MDQIVVGIGDCRIAAQPGQVLATYALGSCIGLSVYDPSTSIGGLLHFMLPDSNLDSMRGRENPYLFADTGIPRLLKEVCGRGVPKRRLIVRAAGAASMPGVENTFEIGKRNYQAMRRILWKAGILLDAEAVGGSQSRTMRLDIATGRVTLLEQGEQRELLPGLSRKGGGAWPTVS